ncbi:hypothetical protein CSAL01_12646 [Colletotrichum salicis]|uniref:Rhodopsin domain-containing protein n=1 Tax=Colletotrichum salicis TaxID=1209931 RepID=A0A135RM93_9PEZI|nr:hypothetical protein CSAL01_12646 [Colletotrichum salicis]
MDNAHDETPLLNRQPAALGIIIVFLILAYVCGLGRLYIRFCVVHRTGWDDGFLIIVLLRHADLSVSSLSYSDDNHFVVSGNVHSFQALFNGLGKHFAGLGLIGMEAFIKTFYICNAAYCMATTFIKLALLSRYLTMFEFGSLSFRLTMLVAVVTAMWGLAYSTIAWFPCDPVSSQWILTQPATARWGFGSSDLGIYRRTYVSHVTTNMVLDMLVCVLPLSWAWRHAAQKRSIYGIVFLFVLGDIVVAIGVSRLVSIANTAAGTYPTLDPSWYGCVPAVLATVEVNLATVCASIPIVWPVTQRALSKIWVTREFEVISEPRDFRLKSTASSYDGDFSDRMPTASISSGPTRPTAVRATPSG